MSILYRNTLLEPAAVKPGYVYPPNDYTGTIRFDRIDDRILWAEAESTRGDDSHWYQSDWLRSMTDIGRNHANAPALPDTNDDESIRECGTAFCLAGSAAIHAGYRPVRDDGELDYGSLVLPGQSYEEARSASNIALEWFGAETVPTRLHEWSDAEKESYTIKDLIGALFAGDNTIVNLKRRRDDLAVFVGFPTRWRKPETPMLDQVYFLSESLVNASDCLDALAGQGVLSLDGVTPDEVLAEMFDIDLEAVRAEQDAVAAWEQGH